MLKLISFQVFGMLQAREITQVSVPENHLPLNITSARFNIEKAAYLGFAKAQTKMGAAYELCQLGCDFDPALSLHYNALAARQGEPDAEMAISKWFLCGYDGIFDKNEELAFTYAQRATQNGLATAEFALGYFYEIGMHVAVDLQVARQWYGKAADHGNKDAAARIDGISRSKTLSKKDHETIAVAKIRSQYGSQRNKRPERFKAASNPMPTINDDVVDMPDPHNTQIPPAGSRPHPHQSPSPAPQRPTSTTPYPMDDRLGPRTVSHNASGYSNPNTRLSSNPSPRYDSQRPPAGAPIRPPQAYQNMDNMGGGRGRGMPSYNNAPGAPGAQGYRQPGSGLTNPSRTTSPAVEVNRPQPPAVDIGFSAPPDPSGADRRRRMQLSDPAGGKQQHPTPTPTASATSADRNSSRSSNLPHPQTFPAANRASSPNPQIRKPFPAGRPNDGLPGNPGVRSNSAVSSPSIPPKTLEGNRPAATPPPNSTTAKPPGKGPKTFEEMGVPQSKKEGECVSFLKEYVDPRILTVS